MDLFFYLNGERLAEEESRRQYQTELDLFRWLADLYDQLAAATKAGSREEIPAHLFLVAQRQLYGVVSQLLRRRVPDAEVLTRKAIEAAGAAQLIWSDPSLGPVFADAYRDAGGVAPDDPKRFRPSPKYWKAFKTGKLFGHPGEEWKFIRVVYSVFSVVASHAGLGATINHALTEGAIRGNPFSPDSEVQGAWYPLLKIYWVVWRVFFGILAQSAEPIISQELSLKAGVWYERFKAESQRSRTLTTGSGIL